jgi:hypothetical protein
MRKIVEYREWEALIQKVLSLPAHKNLKISKDEFLHPLLAGFRKTWGEFRGELANYRKRLLDGKSIHVREFRRVYKVHWDHVDPSVSLLKHLLKDAPHWLVVIVIFLISRII